MRISRTLHCCKKELKQGAFQDRWKFDLDTPAATRINVNAEPKWDYMSRLERQEAWIFLIAAIFIAVTGDGNGK